MSDETKMVTLINNGKSTFLMKSGKLAPGGTITVSEEEAAQVSGYPGVMDVSKAVPQEKGKQRDEAEMNGLREEIQKLHADNSTLITQNERLKDTVDRLKLELAEKAEPPKKRKKT
jgi:hypothetical protein